MTRNLSTIRRTKLAVMGTDEPRSKNKDTGIAVENRQKQPPDSGQVNVQCMFRLTDRPDGLVLNPFK